MWCKIYRSQSQDDVRSSFLDILPSALLAAPPSLALAPLCPLTRSLPRTITRGGHSQEPTDRPVRPRCLIPFSPPLQSRSLHSKKPHTSSLSPLCPPSHTSTPCCQPHPASRLAPSSELAPATAAARLLPPRELPRASTTVPGTTLPSPTSTSTSTPESSAVSVVEWEYTTAVASPRSWDSQVGFH